MKNWFLILLLCCCLKIQATHIVGGEMIYDYLGNDNYRITLKIYRDCFTGQAPFDGLASNGSGITPAVITVLENNSGSLVGVFDIGTPTVTNIPPTINSPCIQTPTNVCVEEGVYTYTVNLPPIAGGYYVVYQRCCRNGTVLNLLVSGNQSSTYYTKIPGPEDAVNNSSPRYKNFPPIFLCNNKDFVFDHSATDPDGDQLVYSLCPPYLGVDGCCSYIGNPMIPSSSPICPTPPSSCPQQAPPPPYAFVNYVAPYDGSYPIASNPSITINPTTGLLAGTPTLIGQYVVGVCVQEFRGNTLVGTHYRDFQFNIVPCIFSVISAVANQEKQCMGSTITFTNQSTSNVGNLTYLWDFGDPNIVTDTSNLVNPTYTYQDTGIYVVTLVADPHKPCDDTVKKTVYVYPPLGVDFIPPPRQCLKNNSFSFTPGGVFLPATTFTWNFTADATPSIAAVNSPTGITFGVPGLFSVKLQAKQFACRDSTVDTVRVLKPPIAKINNLPLALCDPAKVGFSNGSSSDLPLKYYWSFSNGDSSKAFEPIEVFSPAGVYKIQLMIVTQGLCADTSIVSINNVTVNPAPVANFIIQPSVTTIFDPEISISDKSSYDALGWKYSFGDGGTSFFSYEKHVYQAYGDYVITQTVTNQFGCQDTVSHVVRILPEFRFWVPNTFTPDENQLNDIFIPIVIGVINYRFEIFDRWGRQIFETTNTSEGWNGFFKGQECPQDIYAWKITFKNVTDSKEELHCGHVLILKNR